jgi:mRNA-degrading endonuclease RelE of RelBE toxin-antitoxin system
MKKIEYYLIEHVDFQKGVKRLTKKKRFISLPWQVDELEKELEKGNFPGTLHRRASDPVPHEIYKMRLENPDANVGKSNGYRIFYLVVTEQKIVALLTIYYKKEDEAVTDSYIDGLVSGFFLDMLPIDEDEDTSSHLSEQ